jgi:hypothetical protein
MQQKLASILNGAMQMDGLKISVNIATKGGELEGEGGEKLIGE